MGQDLRQLINDDVTSDMQLTSPCGTFAAHRVLLAARSPTFYDLIMNQKLNQIHLDIDDKRVLDCFLQYLYTDTVESADADILAQLLTLSDKYQVPRLKVVCGAYSLEKLTDENWLDSMLTNLL
jgi:hypothetical protein